MSLASTIGGLPSGSAATAYKLQVQLLEDYIRRNAPGSPLRGTAPQAVQAGMKYGVDPRLLIAIARQETQLGTYGPSQPIHNPFGLGPGMSFPSWAAAYDAAAKTISGYGKSGLTSVAQIQTKWAPTGASNDPRGLNSGWVAGVSKFYSELGGNPGAPSAIGGTTIGQGIGSIPSDAAKAVPDNPLSALVATLSSFFGTITSGAFWLRVLMAIAGVALAVIGVVILAKKEA